MPLLIMELKLAHSNVNPKPDYMNKLSLIA